LIFGLLGAAVLISLGVWQVERLDWKERELAKISSTVHGTPIELLEASGLDVGKYDPVKIAGVTSEQEIHVLVSRKHIGAGYRIITAFMLASGDKILLDRGFVPSDQKGTDRPAIDLKISGNLHLPDDRNSSTPVNDVAGNIWFARDISEMAAELETLPVLVVARDGTGQGVDPLPLGVVGISNDHLQYALTWFSLALVWLGMTVFLLWRITQRNS
jgi:surfeit locus 1 family protein